MGNITTHENIGRHVVEVLEASGANEHFTYLLLGNFLTDVSQFRDPYAFMAAKKSGLAVRMMSGIRLGEPWADDLFGRPGDRRLGALSRYLEQFARCLAYLYYSETAPPSAAFIFPLTPLPVAEVDRALSQRYTQYFPHEHFDLPPYREGLGHYSDPLYRRGPRNVIGYAEEQIRFVAEGLALLRTGWLQRRSGSPAGRVDDLLELGHLLHAVEDFFFHSNFCEAWVWRGLIAKDPGRKPAELEDDRRELLGRPLAGALGIPETTDLADRQSVHLRRLFARRLRYPVFGIGTNLDSSSSLEVSEFVFTGGFGSTDVFHTVDAALISLEDKLDRVPELGPALKNTELALLRCAFNVEVRKEAVRDSQAAKKLETDHLKQLADRAYEPELAKLVPLVGLDAIGALTRMYEIDREFEQAHGVLPSIGQFFIKLLVLMQTEIRDSDLKSGDLDRDADSVFAIGSTNASSAEAVGTHSLLSKDTKTKQPLREGAVQAATFASEAVATLMVAPGERNPTAIDWGPVLRHYLRFPEVDPARWEQAVLPVERFPRPNSIEDRPRPPAGAQRLPRRSLRSDLEQRYIDLEKRAQRQIRQSFDVPL